MKQLYGVIGNPIAHSMSPDMHNDAFAHQGINADYHAFKVDGQDLEDAVMGMKAIGVKGFNVTVPHKEAIIPFLDRLDALAEQIGAVNTVKLIDGKWVGFNTDGLGYVKGLCEQLDRPLSELRILLIGAGGAAKGIYYSLVHEGAKRVDIANRTVKRIESLLEGSENQSVQSKGISLSEAEQSLSEYDLIIQTTSIGLKPNTDDMPIRLDNVRRSAFISDIIYNPLETAFLQAAKQKGCQTQNGLPMFVHQGALAFNIWTGISPDPERMKSIVLKKLGG
ncbi:shikimate dehydrogenase [Bacillus sp. 1P06AnD]|uniref:shikimate dehydrogenase n=1 Tax=Bacillus sp. 1P06AnD TaxID=3132208 RepID=UPI00399FA26D